jgi:beta-lactamase regulating signal transducer with metallopeptidase domain
MFDPRIVDVVVKVTLLLGAASLTARALSRGSAAARHHVWAVAIAASLTMPVLATVAPQWTIAVLPATEAPAAAALSADEPVIAPAPDTNAEFEAIPAVSPNFDIVSQPGARSAATVSTAAALWMLGVLVVLTRLVAGTARMWWTARRARPAGAWAVLGEQLSLSLGIDRSVTFLSGAPDTMPMAWGLWRAHVMLPADADEWPATRQRVVLLHELAHVKRRDCVTQLLAQIACAGYWFNPLVWLAARRLRAERERACDDLVLATGTRGSDYADHLLDIARSLRGGAWPTWSAVTMAHRSQLEGRLMAILDPAVPRRSPTRRTVAVLAALASVSIVTLAGVRPVAQGRPSAPAMPAPAPAPAAAPTPAPAPPMPAPLSIVSIAPPAPARMAAVPLLAPTPPMPAQSTPMPGTLAPPAPAPFPDVDIDVQGAVADAVAAALGQSAPDRAQGSVSSADPRVTNALTAALKDEDKDVREQALHALTRMRAPIAGDIYVGLLKDPSPDVRKQAVHALGNMRDPKHAAALGDALKDGDADVRQQAAFALGNLRDPRAIDPLITALKDSDPDVRKQAAFALGRLRDRRAVDPLIAAMKDANADVRQQAVFALSQIR